MAQTILNIKRDGFRLDNTEGFTQDQLDEMNDQLEEKLQAQEIDPEDTDLYNHYVKGFLEDILKSIWKQEAGTMEKNYKQLWKLAKCRLAYEREENYDAEDAMVIIQEILAEEDIDWTIADDADC